MFIHSTQSMLLQTGSQNATEALYIPSEMSLTEMSLRVPSAGWCQFPLIGHIGADPVVYPDSKELREELFTELTRASGQSNNNNGIGRSGIMGQNINS